MIIRTITCHDVYNYGASLQAFALQSYLEHLGHDVKIIDYKPCYQKAYGFSKMFSSNSRYSRYYKLFPFLLWMRACKNYLLSRKTIGRKRAFDDFTKRFLKLTDRFYSYNQLVIKPPFADIYISGSDQIWNTKLPNGSDPAFYMQFGQLNTKRISYAASFANSSIHGGYDCLVRSYLSNIDSISVREVSGLNILKILGIEGVQVQDPVFLLSKSEWEFFLSKIEIPFNNKKYLLCYDLKSTNGLKQRAISLSNEYHLPIVSVNDRFVCKYADININNAGPFVFLKLILNAEYVITDSFHATAFSIIFKKVFWAYYNCTDNTRIKDLLGMINLSDRFNRIDNDCNVQWDIAINRLNYLISKSKKYLKEELEK